MKTKQLQYFVLILLIGLMLYSLALFNSKRPVFLSDLKPASAVQEWGQLQINKSIDGNHFKVNGTTYGRGIGTHANSQLTYAIGNIGREFRFLDGAVGLDDEQNKGNKIEFSIFADDKLIYKSGVLKGNLNPQKFHLLIGGVKTITLVVGDGGDGINCDHADWLNMQLST